MTGRTHDLAAFTALSYTVATQPLPENITLATALVALSANFIGGLAPDIDQPTANLWNRIPAGGIWGRLLSPVLGGHRFISHSILGIFLFGFTLNFILNGISSVLLVNMDVVWWAFMIGFVSHLVMDTITRDGVPWLFPIPINFGFPPFRFMRMKTGGLLEKSVIFPGLIMLNIYIYYNYYGRFLEILKHYIK
jgi:inner membrane protein